MGEAAQTRSPALEGDSADMRMITQKEDIFEQTLVHPGAITSATTAYFDMSDVHTAKWTLAVGATDQAINFKLVQATTAGGAGVKDVPDAAVTALAGTDDNKQVHIEIDPYQLDTNNGYRYVAAVPDVSGGTGTTGTITLKANMKSRPVALHADVKEYVLLVG
jgi:hypothetical protein